MTFKQEISGELSIKSVKDNYAVQREEDLRFVYEKLREEILLNDTLRLQILGFTLVIVSAAMGFTFENSTTEILKLQYSLV